MNDKRKRDLPRLAGENQYPDPVICGECGAKTYHAYACEQGQDGLRWYCSRGCLEKHRKALGKIFPHPKE